MRGRAPPVRWKRWGGWAPARRGALLGDVGQLVREERPPRVGARVVPLGAEHHVPPDRVGVGVQGLRRPCGGGVAMDPNPLDALTNQGLHRTGDVARELLAW